MEKTREGIAAAIGPEAHTLVLAWESVAVSLYARTLLAAGKWFVPVSALVLTAVWIAVCAPVWR